MGEEVNELSIPTKLREMHLFAGAGGGILGGMLLGHTCVCAVEIEPYCQKVLLQRQRDSTLPKFPIWDDVRTFDGKPWRGFVDVVCAGFPCQRHSDIGKMHGSDGFDGWPDTRRIIRECLPRGIFLENVPAILSGIWWDILRDLSELGYDSKWGVFSACSIDYAHTRERLFLLANSRRLGLEAKESRLGKCSETRQSALSSSANRTARISRLPIPCISGRPDELADYVGEIKAIGNGQIPAVAALAWRTLAG